MATGGINLSSEFFELIKAIGESKSKQEEDRIIAKEIIKLKSKLESHHSSNIPPPNGHGGGSSPSVLSSHHVSAVLSGGNYFQNKKLAKEFLVRILYVEMLGHDGSFGYIKAVEMAASSSLYHKRTGYLICSNCLPPHHEFRFMLVNQMQRDLHSANVLECCGGLLACTNIITPDMVPAVMTDVTKLLSHESATIRKKSIICLHKFHQLASDIVTSEELIVHTRKVLCDKDPAVMGSCLNVIHALCIYDATPYKDLVPSLVSILKQITDHRLPSEYDYHRVPAPWMQLKLIRILSILGQGDITTSSGMYEIINDTMKKADTGINAGYAIVYECVKCIVQIYPNTALCNAAAMAIARFMDSRSHNLKYLGVTGLALIVESQPQYAAQHQLAVMDCLEDADETLQRKTLDLLYRMTNPVNVEFIADKLVSFLSGTTDLFLKKQLTQRVCSIAERYAPNNTWYIRTITKLFEVAGDMVTTSTSQNLMNLIAEGTGESDEADMLLRQNAVEIYVTLLREKPIGSLPKILLETMAWCLGEYGYLSSISTIDDVLHDLCTLAKTHKSKLVPSTRRFVLAAIMKLVAQAGTCPPAAAVVIDDYTKSYDVDLQQRCLEFQAILTNCPHVLPEIFPVDASAEDVDVDINLSFLDGYVSNALQNGAQPYNKPDDDDDDDDEYGMMMNQNNNIESSGGFNMTPYDKPTTPGTVLSHMGGIGSSSSSRLPHTSNVPLPPGATRSSSTPDIPSSSTSTTQPVGGSKEVALNVRNVANVWGKPSSSMPDPTPPTTTTPSASIQPTPQPPPTVPSVSTAPSWGSSTSGGTGGGGYPTSNTVAPTPVVKTAAQLEKERQAAALFGGLIPGSTPPPPPPSSQQQPQQVRPPLQSTLTPSVSTTVPVQPAATAAAPPPPPPDIDLLDMGAWDVTPAATSTTTTTTDTNFNDTFAPQPISAPAVVETVSGDDDDLTSKDTTVPNTTTDTSSNNNSNPIDDDPFASAGLFGNVNEKPLPSLGGVGGNMMMMQSKFEYNGIPMAPMPIITVQFGQQWGTCIATSSISIQSTKVTTLQQYMDVLTKIGIHPIEAIATTNEGIGAGMVGAHMIALIHGKVAPLPNSNSSGQQRSQLDITIKGSDNMMCSALVMYMQTMLR
jgi:AP-4 complex subunit epsilon-1